jgi:hypothetical protein
MDKRLRETIMEDIETECSMIGFRKRANSFFTRELSAETVGVLAFVFGKDGDVVVSPSVAIRYQPLERLLADLASEKFHPYLSGTLACPLGEVLPRRELMWYEFPSHVNPRNRVREMIGVISDAAVPWMEKHQDLDSFIEDLGTYRFASRDAVRLRLPTAYYLKKEYEIARSLVMQGLQDVGEGNDPLTVQYRRFAEALLARLDAGKGNG